MFTYILLDALNGSSMGFPVKLKSLQTKDDAVPS